MKNQKSKIKNLLLLIFSYSVIQLFSYSVFGQTINQRDAAGRKQGYWEAVDSRGMPVYRGYFKDDKPVGEMKRYFPTGELRVILNYDNTSSFARVRFFMPNGKLAAQGNYIDSKRDSVWLFYTQSQTVATRVEYVAGKRNGIEQKFYASGNVAEETVWKDDLKDGAWKQYYDNKQLKLTAIYINGKIEGGYKSYYSDGNIEVEGFYRNDMPDGDWIRHDENGSQTTIKYDKGTITNLEELDENEQIIFTKWTEQEQNIPEPTMEDLIREAQDIKN